MARVGPEERLSRSISPAADREEPSQSALDTAGAHVIVPKPKINWFAEFASRRDEIEYRRAEVHDRLCAYILLLCVAEVGLWGGSFVVSIALNGGAWSGFTYVAFVGFLLIGVVHPFFCWLAYKHKLPLEVAEGSLTAVQMIIPIACIFFVSEECTIDAPPHEYFIDSPFWFPSDYSSINVILISRLLLIATMMPMRPVLFLLMVVTNYAALIVEVIISTTINPRRIVMLAFAIFALSGLIVMTNVQLSLVNRGRYFFYRESARTMASREALIRHETETALKLQAAEREQQSRSRLIRIVWHDLRSPLLSVENISVILAAMPPDTRLDCDEAAQCIASLGTCSKLMQNIISDMLDFERIESGRLVLVPVPFVVQELLAVAQATFEGLAKTRGIILTFKPLPRPLRQLRFSGDLRRLQQSLNNGVSNALKFSDVGDVVTVEAELIDASTSGTGAYATEASALPAAITQAGGSALVVSVRDQGVGLSVSELGELHDSTAAFTQVGKGKLQGNSGSGLGLAIARQILAAHNSRLQLVSDGPGKGTTYRMILQLPLASESDRRLSQHSASGRVAYEPPMVPPGSVPTFRPGFRVLHVEDDPFLQMTLPIRLLRPLGIDYDQAANGAIAIDMVTRAGAAKYDLILIDNQMPVQGGAAATRAIRAAGFTSPACTIVGLTGDPVGCFERTEFEAAGLDVCCGKDPKGILEVSELLRRLAVSWTAPDGTRVDVASEAVVVPFADDSLTQERPR